jgi:outer membrane protein TolC
MRNQAEAAVGRTRYEVSAATADAFLTLVAAEEMAKAARAAVESWQVLLTSIHALASAELRPGADESRVQAELAAARTQLAQAEQATGVARSNVAQFVGLEPDQITVSAGKLIEDLPPDRPEPPLEASANPLSIEQRAAVAQAQSQLKAIDRTYYPQFLIQGLASARGTGLLSDGSRLGGLNGLAPTTQNYGVGLTLTFPAMDKFALRQQEALQSANIRAREAESQVIAASLRAQFNSAVAMLDGARRVAVNTPIEVASARSALQQATARYQSGLAPIDEVAQAQRLLVRAQIDDAMARLSVWRARLQVGIARGDLAPFVAEASR